MTTDRTAVVALAHAIAPAHRKLRYGSNHPSKPSQPNTLAFRIAEVLVNKTFTVEIELAEDEDFCPSCFTGTESVEHYRKCCGEPPKTDAT